MYTVLVLLVKEDELTAYDPFFNVPDGGWGVLYGQDASIEADS